MPSGKRKRDEFASQYNAGGYIPQQDGAGDAASGVFEIEVLSFFMLPISSGYFVELYQLGAWIPSASSFVMILIIRYFSSYNHIAFSNEPVVYD